MPSSAACGTGSSMPSAGDWRKSSYSESGNCVEFRKSSHSFHEANCAEVACLPGEALVRDSKDPDGPVLTFGAAAWGTFLGAVQAGEYPA